MVDETDRRILAELQKDAGEAQKVIASNLHIAEPTLSKKIKKLKEDGIIKKYTIDIDFSKIGYVFSAITMVKEKKQSDSKITGDFIKEIPEAIQVFKVTGEWDFAVLWLCRDPDQLDIVISKIHNHLNVDRVESTFFMRVLKREIGIPLGIAPREGDVQS